MQKFYYDNKLLNQNVTAKTDVVWAADFTTINLKGTSDKVHILICIDTHTNFILGVTTSRREITSRNTIKVFEKAVKKVFPKYPEDKPIIPIILHTDRGTQFTSELYKNFIEQHKGYLEPSMSRQGIPKDNSVMERFVRTFKEHKINNNNIQDRLDEAISLDPNFCGFRKLINEYVKSLNATRNTKSHPDTPQDAYKRVQISTKLMRPPTFSKAFSKLFGDDPRVEHISKYKQEVKENSINMIEAAIRAEIVENTPFDKNDIVAFKKLLKVLDLNSEITRAHIDQSLKKYNEKLEEKLDDNFDEVKEMVRMLLPKQKKSRVTQKLRDPLDQGLFPIFLESAGSSLVKHKEIKAAQLRVCYTLLYHLGLRVNELRNITYQEIKEAMEISQITIITYKTKQSHIYVLSKQAIQDLKKRESDFDIIFNKNKYKYLFGKEQPMHDKSIIRFINKDLKHTSVHQNISYNVKSHSFRIHVISSLLKFTSVQKAADVIGHNDIRSTLKYARYSMSKKEIQELMDAIAHAKPERINQTETDQYLF